MRLEAFLGGKASLEAASGFEPLHRGFADLSLNHLGTPPYRIASMILLIHATTVSIIDKVRLNK